MLYAIHGPAAVAVGNYGHEFGGATSQQKNLPKTGSSDANTSLTKQASKGRAVNGSFHFCAISLVIVASMACCTLMVMSVGTTMTTNSPIVVVVTPPPPPPLRKKNPPVRVHSVEEETFIPWRDFPENSVVTFTCTGGVFTSVIFASFGQPPTCNAPNAQGLVQSACVGKAACIIPATNEFFGEDPCHLKAKRLAVSLGGEGCTHIGYEVSTSPTSCEPVPPPHPHFAGSVCIVVRTYRPHKSRDNGAPSYSLPRLLASLQQLQYRHWAALVFDTEQTFTSLAAVVSSMRDDRIQHLQIPNEVGPFDYHRNAGYHTTDFAISQCPPDAQWLLTTNGDNYYFPSFLNHLHPAYDIIAMDFMSRHSDETKMSMSECAPVVYPPCLPVTTPFLNPCMKNTLSGHRTELGANVVSLTRWRRDNVSFMFFIRETMELADKIYGSGPAPQYCAAPCGDGQTMEGLVARNWTSHIHHECLMSHEPNAWSCCTEMNGIWREQECWVKI